MSAAVPQVLSVLAALLCGGVGAFTFVLWARPEYLMGPLASLAGRRGDWLAGRLTAADEALLLDLAGRLRLPLLALLFAWAFLAGVLMSWART